MAGLCLSTIGLWFWWERAATESSSHGQRGDLGDCKGQSRDRVQLAGVHRAFAYF